MLSSIIQTKLHRPIVPPDLVERDHLLKYIEQNFLQSSMTLVSAPAGYGKSTLVSHWLDGCILKSSWLSLDEHDNEFRQFFAYFIAAIRKIFPNTCQTSESMLLTPDFPAPEVVAYQLITDLEEITERFVLVLDDFQEIHDTDVNTFLNELLKLPIPSLHLVITTRRDPPFPISLLRSKGTLTEIRVQDLRFNLEEASSLIENITGELLTTEELNILDKKTEGWPTSLRLTALTLRNREDVSGVLAHIPDDNRYIMDYIVAEVIAKQSAEVQQCLFSISILNRFCPSLCKALCGKELLESAQSGGVSFISWLRQSNLFLIPLDNSHTWFRFHHLFRTLLIDLAQKKLSEDFTQSLHVKAGHWFAENNHVDEALFFLLEGGDTASAVQLFCAQRHNCMNREQWQKLDRWMSKIPQSVINKDPELLIAKSWHFDSGLQLVELQKNVKLAGEAITGAISGKGNISKTLYSEYNALTGFLHYLSGDGQSAVTCCKKALNDVDHSAYSVRGYATIILAGAYQMLGQLGKAYSTVYDAFEEDVAHGTTYHSRLFVSLCFTNWMVGDINGLVQTSRELKKIGYEYNLPESISFGHYFLGVSYYCLNDLDGAKTEFQEIYGKPFYTNIWDYSHSAFGLCLVYMAQGQPDKSVSIVEEIISLAFQKQNNDLLRLGKAFQVELALLSGDKAAGRHWANTFEPKPFRPGYRSYVPQLTLARSLLSESTQGSLDNALHLLRELDEYYRSIHNTRFLVEISLLQALVYHRKGNDSEAFDRFIVALEFAEPGGIIRPFLDFGQESLSLISFFSGKYRMPDYVDKITSALHTEQVPIQNGANKKPVEIKSNYFEEQNEHLTMREVELLILLSDRMTNDEIADQLCISTETVKKHLSNIYRKLEVKNRRQAVMKAQSFGLL